MAKAAILVIALVFSIAVSQIKAAKSPLGRCPAPSGMAGFCVFRPGINCVSDDECTSKGKLCCSEGCGKVCMDPIPPVAPAGVCPKSSGGFGICLFRPGFNCISDAECASKGKLCCSEGCGKVCKDPVKK